MKFLRALFIGATLAFGAVSVTALPGCSVLGVPKPQTFNEKLAVGYASVSAIRDTARHLLIAGKISPADAENVQKQADNARAGLDIAREYHAVDQDDANSKLTAILAALSALNDYLESRS